jgi:hypothetical protein
MALFMNADAYQLQGGNGGTVVTAASGTVTGSFRWVSVVEAAVLEAITSTLTGSATLLITKTLPAGVGIGGVTTSIKVTSGTVIAYK